MEANVSQREITLQDILEVIFRAKWVIISTFIATMFIIAVALQLKTPVFEGEVKMLVTAKKKVEAGYYYKELADFRRVEIALTQSELVNSSPVLSRVVIALSLDQRTEDYEKQFCSYLRAYQIDMSRKIISLLTTTYQFLKSLIFKIERKAPISVPPFVMAMDNLKRNIEVLAIKDTDLFTITVKDFDPIAAATIANVVSRSYLIFDLEQQLVELQIKFGEKHPAVIQLQDTITKMNNDLTGEQLPTIEAMGSATIKIVDQATIPFKPSGFPQIFLILGGILFGLGSGVILAFVLEYLDQTLKSPQNIENFLGLSYLGSIPRRTIKTQVLIEDASKNDLSIRPYHSLSDEMYLLMKEKDLRSVLFTPMEVSREDATIMANIGLCLAYRTDQRVLLIDANLRDPSLDIIFNLSSRKGFSDLVEGKIEIAKAIQNGASNLDILPAGKSRREPLTLLGSPLTGEVLKKVKEKYDIILLRCAALSQFKDVILLSSYFNDIIFILNEGKTRRQTIRNAIGPLQQKKVNLVGAILNKRTYPIPKVIYDRI